MAGYDRNYPASEFLIAPTRAALQRWLEPTKRKEVPFSFHAHQQFLSQLSIGLGFLPARGNLTTDHASLPDLPGTRRAPSVTTTNHAPLSRSAYELGHCQVCDLVYLSPLPTEEDLRVMYVDELQFDYHIEEDERVIAGFLVDRLRDLMNRIGLDKPPSVLEIGAGPAWIRVAKAVSPLAFTIAHDITREMADKCPLGGSLHGGAIRFPGIGPYRALRHHLR